MRIVPAAADLLRLARDEGGVTAVCYAVIGAAVLVVVSAGTALIMGPVGEIFDLFVAAVLGS